MIKSYAQAIDQVVESYFEQYAYLVSPNLFLGTPNKIFPNLNVIGFIGGGLLEHSVETKIAEGDMLFAVNNNASEKNISGKIISLRIDGVPQKAITLPCEKPLSIAVNFDISTNLDKRSFYVVPHT